MVNEKTRLVNERGRVGDSEESPERPFKWRDFDTYSKEVCFMRICVISCFVTGWRCSAAVCLRGSSLGSLLRAWYCPLQEKDSYLNIPLIH